MAGRPWFHESQSETLFQGKKMVSSVEATEMSKKLRNENVF